MNIPEQIREMLAAFSFRGNSKLRPAGAIVEYTQDMIDEYAKCKADPIYFICNHCKTTNVDNGTTPLHLYEYQKKLIKSYVENRKTVAMQPRQSGKTQCTAAFLLWYVTFNDSKTCAVLANKAPIARETLSRVQFMYEELPKFLQQGVKTWNKGSIELENGSRILCAATSSSGLRGYSLSLIYLDEYAIIPNNVADDFITSMFPTISSGKETKIIVSSTPLGYNHFHKLWNDAEKGINGFIPIRAHWWEHPNRDEEWSKEQLRSLGELKYSQEVECLGGKSIVTIKDERGIVSSINLETLYNKYKYIVDNEEKEDDTAIYIPSRMERRK